MAHFQMSTGGSKSNEHVDHFLVDIHNYFEGMNDTEIAELFDTSRSTIQYRRTSSFELLKKYLEENADEWDEW